MKKIIALIIIIALILVGKKGYGYLTKYRHAKKIKVSVDKFRFPDLKLQNLITDVLTEVTVIIGNFSSTTFNIEQINIDVLDETGQFIAEQKNPLPQAIQLLPNKNNALVLTFLISPQHIRQLIKKAGGAINVGTRYLTTGKYGIPLQLKGFVVAEGFSIDINENITV